MNEPEAFAAVYEDTAVGAVRFLARRTLEVEVARDLTAETFAVAFRDRRRFRGTTDGTPHATTAALPTWIVPTSTGAAALHSLALGATGPGTGVAADVAMLLPGRAYMTTDDGLIGLAPNGVRMVTVSLDDGSTVGLPVVDNVFGAQSDQPVTSVELGGRR